MIVARSDYPVDDSLCEKIAQFCDVEKRAVIPMVTAPILYEIPLLLEKAKVAEFLMERLKLKPSKVPNWQGWEKLVSETKREKPIVKIALVGKYVELHDAISACESRSNMPRSLWASISTFNGYIRPTWKKAVAWRCWKPLTALSCRWIWQPWNRRKNHGSAIRPNA
jgi:hypothetical protein